MAGLGLRPVSDTSDRRTALGQTLVEPRPVSALDRLRPASLKQGGLG